MLETIGENEIYVKNYTSNFDIKEYIQQILVPKYFPDVPMNSLNLGLVGLVSEYISNGIEDAYGTSSLMMNEAFITKAILPKSIYANASLFDLGYKFATPSQCKFALQVSLTDIEKYAEKVPNTNIYRYCIDKDTRIQVSELNYRLDYDIYIDYQIINGEKQYSVYYNIDHQNSIAKITNKYLNYRVTNIDWLVIFVNLQEFDRKFISESITNNSLTVNSNIQFSWSTQLAGFDLVYILPTGERINMIKKHKYTDPEIEPFAWYEFINENTIELSFTSNGGYFQPQFNSTIEITIYSCLGALANFTDYNDTTAVSVLKKSNRYEYNATTRMVALCYGSSINGSNIGTIDELKKEVILAYKTGNSISTDNDLKAWFETKGKTEYTHSSELIKKRDDPSGRLYSQFIAIQNSDNEIFPTNTLNIKVNQSDFDQINDINGINNEFIINAGHVWTYDEESLDTVVMIKDANDKPIMISDDNISSSGHIFVNPFFIKILREPTFSSNYNCLLNNTSMPEEIDLNKERFYQFQLTTMNISRTLKENNKYHIKIICVPATDEKQKYVKSVDPDANLANNDLRVILIFRSSIYGDTGYMELKPSEYRNNGSIMFEGDFYVKDQLNSNNTIEIDLERTEANSILESNNIYIDASETNFHFITLMKKSSSTNTLYNDPRYQFYDITNKFSNTYRDLNLMEPLTMMRSSIQFIGENNNYTIKLSSIPFIKSTLALDQTQMLYFIQAFNTQYERIKPVLSRLDGFLDLKLYNSYGKSNNYYIGPEDGLDNLYDSNIRLDSVYVKIKFRMNVNDRSIYSITETDVKNEIKKFFNSLINSETKAIHISNLIRTIENNISNVNYIRFLGFNDYDARKQSIFIKNINLSNLNYVPEILCIDNNSIEISEEI